MKFKFKIQLFKNFANYNSQNSTLKYLFKRSIFFCWTFLASVLWAQEFNMNSMPPPEMSMEYSVGELNDNSQLYVRITIPPKWHVNADTVTDEFLKPSSIEVKALGIEFGSPKWPTPIKQYNEALELEILTFQETFVVEIPVKNVEKNYDSLGTEVTFYYQACDNSICLAPTSKTIRLDMGKINSNGNNSRTFIEQVENNFIEENTDFIENSASYSVLLFFAFIGGIILNLMPCVLPVLSLKLFSLIKQAGESHKRLLLLGASTTTGILVSFWILAFIVLVIKNSGGATGWGMQFQSAGFIAFMVIILSAFAMSFLGVFEIWLPWNVTTKMDNASHKQGLGGAFFTGALLVLLSTPCSAPFLGSAMGFAFSQSSLILFLFFTATALGLALPYILVSLFPRVLKIFPKPGPWMVYIQKIMGVMLILSVVWLLWIVYEQSGFNGVTLFVIIIFASLVCSIMLGKFAPPGVAFKREVIGIVISFVLLFSLWFGGISSQYNSILDNKYKERLLEQKTANGWFNYSTNLINDLAQKHQTIFIDVTADWCLTCKANEVAVLNRKEFRQAMDSLNVALVKADWTRESSEVNALLKSMKKSGVPAYAIYIDGSPQKQIVLPEILTTASIVEKIIQNKKIHISH